MVNLIDLVSEMFAAYGREASEENLRAYVAVLKQGNPDGIVKAVVDATSGGYEKLPTAAQLLKLSHEILKYESEAGQRNKIKHEDIRHKYNQRAIRAGWSLAQRDELLRICDRAIDQKTGNWLWSEERLRQEVSELVYEVDEFRQKCDEARNRNTQMPDEEMQSWGKHLAKDGETDYDPAKESLWDVVRRIAESRAR